ncbi:MAG: histidine phosphatase family protein [Treponema sp.]|nr:histidine phosphatase family protein [Spirochaetia bacterium]MDD7459433.1 histidine phosphatase family protein [Spirochaetales bacterium]MDY5810542.1 histidine phosphatase family protein [Treponema sp.]
MHLIFIRHGDPDYSIDSVTEKGKKELELLADRLAGFKATEFYVSPMGRAQKTAEACLSKINVDLTKPPVPVNTLPWLREFSYDCINPKTKMKKIPWDNLPMDYYPEKKYRSYKDWFKTKLMKSGNIESHFHDVCNGIDEILSSWDYNRVSEELPIYNCFPNLTPEEAKIDHHLDQFQKDYDPKKLVFVCHLGVMFTIISHLTGMSPVQLWQNFFVAPSSITVLGAEERVPGEVVWRIQRMGDVRHLESNGEHASASGYFGNFLEI